VQQQTSPLTKLRERMRPEVEAALAHAVAELEDIESRRRELVNEIDRAQAFLDGGEEVHPSGRASGITLRASMETVLRERGPMRVPRLAEEIRRRGLYMRGDGTPADPHQIHAYIHNYPETFERIDRGVVALRGIATESLPSTRRR
jgi:hypothetical protein